MSFTTRCPACGTMFKVVADQLKISDGWVRCGHCADVFDATLNLHPVASGEQGAATEPRPNGAPNSATAGSGIAKPAVRLSVQKAPRRNPGPPAGVVGRDPVVDASGRPAAPTPFVPSGRTPLGVPVGEPDVPGTRPGARLAGTDSAWDLRADSGRAPLSDAGDSGWLLPPSLDEVRRNRGTGAAPTRTEVSSLRQDVPPAAPAGQSNGVSAAKSGGDSGWLDLAPARRPSAPVERETDFAPLDDGWSDNTPDIDLTDSPTSGFHAEFQDELERFAAAGAQAQKAQDEARAAAPVSRLEAVPKASEAIPPPRFVVQARRQAFWRSTPMQVLQVLLVAGLSVLLVLQWTLHERDPLAARYPALAPWLTRLCEPLDCRVSAPRRIDAVVIDSSQLVRRQGSAYAFDLVLKNTAGMAVAMPALELTLTDQRDTVIARRVFLPDELPGAPVALPATGSLPLALRLSLADGDALSMTGYRALLFYP